MVTANLQDLGESVNIISAALLQYILHGVLTAALAAMLAKIGQRFKSTRPSPDLTYPDLLLQGSIVPKARPRVTKRGAFIPKKYRQWKDGAIAEFKRQWGDRSPLGHPVSVSISLRGKHYKGSDLDNLAGSILDALQQAGILKNDNCGHVPSLSIRLAHDPVIAPFASITFARIKEPLKLLKH